MNLYVTGNTIKQLREQKKMTQAELADKIDVSSKTISKWETAKGCRISRSSSRFPPPWVSLSWNS